MMDYFNCTSKRFSRKKYQCIIPQVNLRINYLPFKHIYTLTLLYKIYIKVSVKYQRSVIFDDYLNANR